MAVDATKIAYSSGWDIDQLIATDSAAVGVGATAIYTIPSSLPAIPEYEVQLLVGGRWYQAGTFATANTVATVQNFFTYVSAGQIFINTDIAGTARYFAWADKVNY